MEKYLEHTEAYLAMFSEILEEKEINKAIEAGNKIYNHASEVSKEDQLSIRELLFTSLIVNHTIVTAISEEIEKDRELELNEDEV